MELRKTGCSTVGARPKRCSITEREAIDRSSTRKLSGHSLPLLSPTTPSPHSPSRFCKTPRVPPSVQPTLRSNSLTPIATMRTLPHSTASHPSHLARLFSAKSLRSRRSTSRSDTSLVSRWLLRGSRSKCKDPKRSSFAHLN